MQPTENAAYKGATGWQAETRYDFPHPGGGTWTLKVRTNKDSRKNLATAVSVDKVDGAFLSHRLFTDYHAIVARSPVRVTEKAVKEQHAEMLKSVETLMANAVEHYQTKGEAA